MLLSIAELVKSIGEKAEHGGSTITQQKRLAKLLLYLLGDGPKKTSSLRSQAIALPEVHSIISDGIGVDSIETVYKLRSMIGAYPEGNLVLKHISIEEASIK